ncbi:hypothetical protein BD410DRAFT_809981 [Rickenella mellea]|uniref:Secreted protein n=1 Tax=Rickenella mellea TaxID=50990 RepID=A0A4Y7PFG9_9AGAM|nr:hypothetical protein BD410DRAFT_809981 [Rickenella mellea]
MGEEVLVVVVLWWPRLSMHICAPMRGDGGRCGGSRGSGGERGCLRTSNECDCVPVREDGRGTGCSCGVVVITAVHACQMGLFARSCVKMEELEEMLVVVVVLWLPQLSVHVELACLRAACDDGGGGAGRGCGIVVAAAVRARQSGVFACQRRELEVEVVVGGSGVEVAIPHARAVVIK